MALRAAYKMRLRGPVPMGGWGELQVSRLDRPEAGVIEARQSAFRMKFLTDQESILGVSVWFFAESNDGQMRRLSAAQFFRFHRGQAGIPGHRDGALHTAEVAVELLERRVARVLRVVWPRYGTTPSGHVDEVHREEAMRVAVRMVGGLMDTDVVVDLNPHLARRDMGRTHQWRPSEDQLQQVANTLNRAAIQLPVVAVARGELSVL